MNRSTGVTVVAILAILGSVGMFGMAALSVVGVLAGTANPPSNFPGSPTFFRAILIMVPLMYRLLAALGLWSGIDLLRLKNWARISTIVFSILLIVASAFTALGSLGIFLAPPGPGMDSATRAGVASFVVVVGLIQLGIGIWWAVYLNRPSVKDQFVARPVVGMTPGMNAESWTPHPLQPSYNVPPPPSLSGNMQPTAQPRVMVKGPERPLSISIIAWFLLAGCLFFPVALLLRTPVAVFVWTLTGWPAAVFQVATAAVLVYVGVGLLRLNPRARVAGLAYYAFTIVNTAVFFLGPGSQARVERMLEQQQSMFPWMRAGHSAYPQPDPMFSIGIGVVAAVVFALVPAYFLIITKRAFEKRAST